MMKMKDAFEKVKELGDKDAACSVDYRMTTYNQLPCSLYIDSRGHFEGATWEIALEALIRKIINMPPPPDEDGSLKS